MSEYKIVFLTDGVVTLRPVLREDIPFFLACINDPSVRKYVRNYMPMMELDEENWLKRLTDKRDTNICFAIEVDGKIVGTMGIHNIEWKDRVGTTGAMIKDVDNRGKGYGTRAKMLLLYHAFYECNLRKIRSSAIAFNTASIRFNEKCGYKREGVLRQEIFSNGEYHDQVMSAVFREDFEPLWEAHKEKYNIVL
jgi:RimJ/RimL family protein N-acetyltransferase